MHADGRALHEALDPGPGRLFDDVADAIDVDVPVGLLRHVGRPVESRDVLHGLDAVEHALEAFPVQKIAGHQLQVRMREVRSTIRRPVHAPCRNTFSGQVLTEPGAGESIRAGHEDLAEGRTQPRVPSNLSAILRKRLRKAYRAPFERGRQGARAGRASWLRRTAVGGLRLEFGSRWRVIGRS